MDFSVFRNIILDTGFMHLTFGNIIMWAIALTFITLAIKKNYEPLLLIPIGFGMFIVNLPLTDLMKEGHLLWVPYHYAIDHFDLIPPIIFMGIGAMTDFGPVIANPKTLLLGAGAQFGVYVTFFGSLLLGFNLHEAASIGIIGGADGPTAIFVASGQGEIDVSIPSQVAVTMAKRNDSFIQVSIKIQTDFIMDIFEKIVLISHMLPDFLKIFPLDLFTFFIITNY